MINFAENLNKMITAGLGGEMSAPRTEVAVGHRLQYLDASGPVASFETNIVAPLKKLLVTMLPIQEGSGNPMPDNIRPISGRDEINIYLESEYDDTADPAATIQLGQTVYGGTLDVTTGKLTVMSVYALLNDPDKWIEYTGSVARYQYTKRYSDRKLGSRSIVQSSAFPVFHPSLPLSIGWLNYTNSPFIGIVDSNNTLSLEDLKTLAGNNSISVVYELEEPVEIDLTPQQITALIGDNNVWSDAGDVEVTYTYYEETEGY